MTILRCSFSPARLRTRVRWPGRLNTEASSCVVAVAARRRCCMYRCVYMVATQRLRCWIIVRDVTSSWHRLMRCAPPNYVRLSVRPVLFTAEACRNFKFGRISLMHVPAWDHHNRAERLNIDVTRVGWILESTPYCHRFTSLLGYTRCSQAQCVVLRWGRLT